MHEIHPNLLWIGHAFDIREPRHLFEAGITAVIDVAYEEPPAHIPNHIIARIAEIKSLELKTELWSDLLGVFPQI